MMKYRQLKRWVDEAAVGDEICYHTGHLQRDRQRSTAEAYEADRKARLMLLNSGQFMPGRRWRRGQTRLALLQKKHGPDDYVYLARKLQEGPPCRT